MRSKIFKIAIKGAVSVIQQCPVTAGSVCLLAQHIKGNRNSIKKEILSYDNQNWRNGVIIHGNNYTLVWNVNFSGISSFDSYQQTREIFQLYNEILSDNGMTLIDNTIKTWIYIRDIDNHYKGMIESRKAFFMGQGLTPETRYIASTGIVGSSKEMDSIISLDALSISKLKPEQIVPIDVLENLTLTIEYGVPFERGILVRFGDRSHLYISGTASIDKNGKVLHISDVKRQTQRNLENIQALLEPLRASMNDMAYLIVYLRSFKDKNKVMEVLIEEIPHRIPCIFVVGAICCNTWLVEIEGIAIIKDSNDFPTFL